jgi:hypothetical protein
MYFMLVSLAMHFGIGLQHMQGACGSHQQKNGRVAVGQGHTRVAGHLLDTVGPHS